MIANLSTLPERVNQCTCGHKHFDIAIEKIEISNEAFEKAAAYLLEKSFTDVTIVTDEVIQSVLGDSFHTVLKNNGINVHTCVVEKNNQGDVVANEEALVQGLLETPNHTDVLLAVGSGTLHDITRFVSYKMGKPFISIPTAPSVDGFNSMGAPVVVKGMKKTFQMQAPIALFAQVDVLAKSPKKMIAAGFGDILGKYTSLTDWTFGHLVADEPYCPLAAEITNDALQYCVDHIEQIAAANEEGVKILLEGLVASGLAMLLIGHSAPASGAEHHISHIWEMEFLRNDQPQILHGAKVGVTAQIIAQLYKEDFVAFLSDEQALQELQQANDHPAIWKVITHKQEIIAAIDKIPSPAQLKQMIDDIGGDSTPEALGVEQTLVQTSLGEAHLIRDRFTMLYFSNHFIS
ncbi:sn-glycerol-1-phosphate dehydrogenase [Bacillus solitudinis]|uniref:sn-glycerol-1-phosphate dehydrogenase n=1 Tax=Bacillus solitudinis TaxID=2014074 RepID=UPI000C242976|nr:sn-glycerol-1-phosphate dehydrogenase [Bacillus solitudinis]